MEIHPKLFSQRSFIWLRHVLGIGVLALVIQYLIFPNIFLCILILIFLVLFLIHIYKQKILLSDTEIIIKRPFLKNVRIDLDKTKTLTFKTNGFLIMGHEAVSSSRFFSFLSFVPYFYQVRWPEKESNNPQDQIVKARLLSVWSQLEFDKIMKHILERYPSVKQIY